MQCTDAMAFEAAAALDAYDEQLLELRRTGPQPGRVHLLQQQLARVCSCCMPLPQLLAPSIALLLAHRRYVAEMAGLGQGCRRGAASPGLEAVTQCIGLLQRRCRELFLAAHLQ